MLLDTISRYTTNSPGTNKRLLYPFGMFKLFSMNYVTRIIQSLYYAPAPLVATSADSVPSSYLVRITIAPIGTTFGNL